MKGKARCRLATTFEATSSKGIYWNQATETSSSQNFDHFVPSDNGRFEMFAADSQGDHWSNYNWPISDSVKCPITKCHVTICGAKSLKLKDLGLEFVFFKGQGTPWEVKGHKGVPWCQKCAAPFKNCLEETLVGFWEC
jgi:hypothetical protein